MPHRVESRRPSESSQTSGYVQANVENADEVWSPDLNADGQSDIMILTAQYVRFAVARDGDYLDVIDVNGEGRRLWIHPRSCRH